MKDWVPIGVDQRIVFGAVVISNSIALMSEEGTSSRSTRVRKEVQRINYDEDAKSKESQGTVIPAGRGVKLGDIAHVEEMLSKLLSDHDLCKAVHSIMFKSAGKKLNRKKNIRQFCGFEFEKGSAEHAKVVEKLSDRKWTTAALKDACQLFGLERGGDKATIVERICDFLDEPKGSASSGKKRARASTGSAKKKKAKVKSTKGEKKPRAPTAFFIFSGEHRATVRAENPSFTMPDVARKLGEMWRELDAGKAAYEAKAAKAKAEMEAGGEE